MLAQGRFGIQMHSRICGFHKILMSCCDDMETQRLEETLMVSEPHFRNHRQFSELRAGATVAALAFAALLPLAFCLSVRDAHLMSLAGLLTAASLAVVPLLVHSREANERHLHASKLMGPMAAFMTVCIWGLLRELQIPAIDPSVLKLLVFAALVVVLVGLLPKIWKKR